MFLEFLSSAFWPIEMPSHVKCAIEERAAKLTLIIQALGDCCYASEEWINSLLDSASTNAAKVKLTPNYQTVCEYKSQ